MKNGVFSSPLSLVFGVRTKKNSMFPILQAPPLKIYFCHTKP